MTLLVRRRGEHRRMPWQNGGGVTYEVARAPDGAGSTAYTWRISIAEVVNDGPFSSLPGIDRIIVLIEGAQMALTIDGIRRLLPPEQPFAFSGDSRVTCEVPSPTRDLNVMTRRGSARATVEVLRAVTAHDIDPCGADQVAAVCVDGPVQVSTRTGAAADLDTLDATLCSGSGPVTVSGPGALAAVRIWVTADSGGGS
jgi:uncharacterized protein